VSELAERPADPVVGLPVPHESARLHVTGTAAYTDDLSVHAPGVLTAWPVQSANAHARVTIVV
jgi:xanthine dehydrogenase large subunit